MIKPPRCRGGFFAVGGLVGSECEAAAVIPIPHRERKTHVERDEEGAGVGGEVAVADGDTGELPHLAVIGRVDGLGLNIDIQHVGHIVGHDIDVVDSHAVGIGAGAVDGVEAQATVGALVGGGVELAARLVDGEAEARHVGGYLVGHSHLEHTHDALHDDVEREAVGGREGGVGVERLLDFVLGKRDDAAAEGAGVCRVVGHGDELVGAVGLERGGDAAEVGGGCAFLVETEGVGGALLDDVDIEARADGADAGGGLAHGSHLVGREADCHRLFVLVFVFVWNVLRAAYE